MSKCHIFGNHLSRLITEYISLLVYCRKLAPGAVSLTGDRAQGDDSNQSAGARTCDNVSPIVYTRSCGWIKTFVAINVYILKLKLNCRRFKLWLMFH